MGALCIMSYEGVCTEFTYLEGKWNETCHEYENVHNLTRVKNNFEMLKHYPVLAAYDIFILLYIVPQNGLLGCMSLLCAKTRNHAT